MSNGEKSAPTKNDTKSYKAISIRLVDSTTWKNFKKLAALRELSLNEYLKHLVENDLKQVHFSIDSKHK